MLLFNVLETTSERIPNDDQVLIRINGKLAEYADPTTTDLSDLLCVQTDSPSPFDTAPTFSSWNVLQNCKAHWRGSDWDIHMVQPIENGASCFILLNNEEEI